MESLQISSVFVVSGLCLWISIVLEIHPAPQVGLVVNRMWMELLSLIVGIPDCQVSRSMLW